MASSWGNREIVMQKNRLIETKVDETSILFPRKNNFIICNPLCEGAFKVSTAFHSKIPRFQSLALLLIPTDASRGRWLFIAVFTRQQLSITQHVARDLSFPMLCQRKASSSLHIL